MAYSSSTFGVPGELLREYQANNSKVNPDGTTNAAWYGKVPGWSLVNDRWSWDASRIGEPDYWRGKRVWTDRKAKGYDKEVYENIIRNSVGSGVAGTGTGTGTGYTPPATGGSGKPGFGEDKGATGMGGFFGGGSGGDGAGGGVLYPPPFSGNARGTVHAGSYGPYTSERERGGAADFVGQPVSRSKGYST